MSGGQGVDSSMNSSEVKTDNGTEVREMSTCPYIEDKDGAIREMLKTNYGLTLSSLKPLNGYEDLNFHVRVDQAYSNSHIDAVQPEGYFLKVCNPSDTLRPELLNAQRMAMDHLLHKGIACQEAVKGVDGEIFTKISSKNVDGAMVTYAVSLRTFLPGRVIEGLQLTAPLLFNLGVFAAKVADALKDFNHPYYETFDHMWSMNNMSKVSDALFAVKDEKMRSMSAEVIKAFETDVLSNRDNFRKSLIHGDLNNHNILVTTGPSGSSYTQVSGLLDFQDSAKSHPLYDIALLTAYMLMTGNADVPQLEIPGYLLAGYTSVLKLPQAEQDVLRTCVAARMVMSLVYGAYSFHFDPTNEYLLDTARFGWQALTQFWEADAQTMQDRWYEIATTYTI